MSADESGSLRRSARAWALALGVTAAALALRAALDPWLGAQVPFITLFGAVALAVWGGGTLPAVGAAAVGYVAARWLFMAPRGRFAGWEATDAGVALAYAASCALIIAFGAALHRAGRRLRAEVATRLAAEDSVRAQRERLRTKLESIADGVIATDLDARITSINPAAQALTGWPGDEALGRALDEVLVVSADDASPRPADDPVRRALSEGRPARVGQPTLLRTRDGREQTIEENAAPIRDAHGVLVGAVVVFRDVAERRRAAGVDARLATLVRHSHDAIVSATPEGVIDSWNPAAERIFGWPAGEAIGRPMSFHVPPERLVEQRELVARALAGETVSAETVRLTRSGQRIDVLLRITPLRDADGRPHGHVGTLQDISARKRAEGALRESAATLRVFYDNAPVMMGVVELTDDGDVRHVYDNPIACRLFGVAPEALAGRLGSELGMPPSLRAEWIGHYRAAARDGRPQSFDFGLERPDGPHWFSATVSAVGTGADGRMRFGYVCEDTTERQRAATRLRESEAAARLALAVAQAGTWQWDPAGEAVDADARCREMAGLGDGPLTLREALARVHRDDRARVEAMLGSALVEPGSEAYAEEFRCVHPDGRVRWVIARGQVVEFAPQGARRLIGTLFDITDRRVAEDALRAADRRKDEFLATLAHELRNPLAPIRSAGYVLGRVAGDVPAAQAPLAIIERQLGHMVRLIDDLMDLSRVSSDKLELRRERLDVSQVVQQAIETSRPLIEAGRHALALTLPPAPLHVHGDLTRLAQVLSNLLNNAAKYTPAGGHIALEVHAAGDESQVEIVVADDGLGIPPELLPRVFDMFTQVDRTLDRAQGGLGIGLAIASRLVALHGGTLSGESAGAGQGSRFVVRLPRAAERADAAPLAAPAPSAPGARRVLVADDNPDSADSLGELLRLLGNRTEVAHDGVQALQVAEAFHPEVALLDIGMPGLDGYEVARRLRAAPWGGPALLIAVTGWGQAEDRRKSREAGFDHHVVKPVDLETIERLLA